MPYLTETEHANLQASIDKRDKTIDRLTAEKEMLRNACQTWLDFYMGKEGVEQKQVHYEITQALSLTAPSKESDIERDVRTAGQG